MIRSVRRFTRTRVLGFFLAAAIFHLAYCVLVYPYSKNGMHSEVFILSSGADGEFIDSQNFIELKLNKSRIYRTIDPTRPFFIRKHEFDCQAIISGDQNESSNATSIKRPTKSEYEMSKIFADCKLFRRRHFYPQKPYSREEATFPLAFLILLNEHLEQIELFFNAIYAPQNFYCFHVDLKAPYLIHYSIKKLSECFPDQVFLTDKPPLPTSRESSHTLHVIRQCFQKLVSAPKRPTWKYAFTLQGHDFPLRTNRELVSIMTLHDGMNDFELTQGQRNRYSTVYETKFDELGIPHSVNEVVNSTKEKYSDERLVIYKGNVAGSFSRQFVEFVLKDNTSEEYLNYLDTAYMPDELYFSTLNHNEFLNAPGGYPGQCVSHKGEERKSWISRFSLWMWYDDNDKGQTIKRNTTCKGEYRNAVCLLSSSDLPMLADRHELFMNKFWIPQDPVAIDCMHEFLYNRTLEQSKDRNWELPNLEHYSELAAVKFHKWRLENPQANISDFQCVNCINCEH